MLQVRLQVEYFRCWPCRICNSSARSRRYLAQASRRVPTHNIEWISCVEALICIGNIVINQPYDGICSYCTGAGKNNRWSTGFSGLHIFLSAMSSGPLLLGSTHSFEITSYMDALAVFRVDQIFSFRVFCQSIGRPNTTKWWHPLLIRLLR